MRLARVITTAVLAVGAPAAGYGASTLAGSDATGPTTAPATGDDTSAFVDCMRSHGLADFPDVTVVDGRLVLDLDGTSVDPLSEAYRDALAACESQLPEGVQLPADPEPPEPAAPPTPEEGEMPPRPPADPPAPTAPS